MAERAASKSPVQDTAVPVEGSKKVEDKKVVAAEASSNVQFYH